MKSISALAGLVLKGRLVEGAMLDEPNRGDLVHDWKRAAVTAA